MAVTNLVARGQARAEALMVDTCKIFTVTSTFDPATGDMTETETIAYQGKCKFQRYDGQTSSEDNVAWREVTHERLYCHVPVAVTGVAVDMQVEALTSADSELVGVEMHVKSLFGKTHATARRLLVEQVTS